MTGVAFDHLNFVIDFKKIDLSPQQTLETGFLNAQGRKMPYYIVTVINCDGTDSGLKIYDFFHFKNTIYKSIIPPQDMQLIALPCFKFDTKEGCIPICLQEEKPVAKTVHSGNLDAEQLRTILNSLDYVDMNSEKTQRQTQALAMKNEYIKDIISIPDNSIEQSKEEILWYWCASQSETSVIGMVELARKFVVINNRNPLNFNRDKAIALLMKAQCALTEDSEELEAKKDIQGLMKCAIHGQSFSYRT